MIRIAQGMLAAMAFVLLASCVTIHIYFPAAAAEEAARVIVRDILEAGAAEPGAVEPGAVEPGEGAVDDAGPRGDWRDGTDSRVALQDSRMSVRWAERVLDQLVPPVRAQTVPDLEIDTPATRALRDAMRARNAELAPYLRTGVIGFGIEGLIVVRDLSSVALRERAALQRSVNEENADRNALYREIARANGRPDWEDEIRAIFARVWVEEAPSGYWYEATPGNWQPK